MSRVIVPCPAKEGQTASKRKPAWILGGKAKMIALIEDGDGKAGLEIEEMYVLHAFASARQSGLYTGDGCRVASKIGPLRQL